MKNEERTTKNKEWIRGTTPLILQSLLFILHSSFFLQSAVSLAYFLHVSTVSAQNPCPGKKVKVTMVVILASEEGRFVDKKLTAIAEEVRLKYPNLKSFKLKSMATESLAAEEKFHFPLVENRKALVILKHCADKENRVSLAVTAPDQGEIVYRSVCGKYLPIVTRYQTQNKELLILAIRVQPCKDE